MMDRSKQAALLAMMLAAAFASPCALADVPSTVQMAGAPGALTRLFQAQTAKPEWFTPAFLEQVPIAQVNAVLAGATKQYGQFQNVDGSGMDYLIHLARGTVHARIVVDPSGQIAALMLTP